MRGFAFLIPSVALALAGCDSFLPVEPTARHSPVSADVRADSTPSPRDAAAVTSDGGIMIGSGT